jgi:hypothetical protein
MKTYGEVASLLHEFLTSKLDEYEWSVLRSGHFIPVDVTPKPQDMRIGEPQADLDTVWYSKTVYTCRKLATILPEFDTNGSYILWRYKHVSKSSSVNDK